MVAIEKAFCILVLIEVAPGLPSLAGGRLPGVSLAEERYWKKQSGAFLAACAPPGLASQALLPYHGTILISLLNLIT